MSLIRKHVAVLQAWACLALVTNTVDYHWNRGSHVFTCFVDYRKVFNRVNYWKLFMTVLDDNADSQIVRVMASCCSNQECLSDEKTVYQLLFT